MDMEIILKAWSLASELNSREEPATTQDIASVEAAVSYSLPHDFRRLYSYSNGASLFNGNFNYHPLSAVDRLSLRSASIQLREWEWPIPKEVLVFGDNGSDDQFGLWMPTTKNKNLAQPIIQIGEIFEPGCMAFAGSSLLNFLLTYTSLYLMLEEGFESALDLLGVPKKLRTNDPDDDDFVKIRNWADPNLTGYSPDPYECKYDAEEIKKILSTNS